MKWGWKRGGQIMHVFGRSLYASHGMKKMLHKVLLRIAGVTQRVPVSHIHLIIICWNLPMTRGIHLLPVSVISISREKRKIVGLFPFPSRVTTRMPPSANPRRIRCALARAVGPARSTSDSGQKRGGGGIVIYDAIPGKMLCLISHDTHLPEIPYEKNCFLR